MQYLHVKIKLVSRHVIWEMTLVFNLENPKEILCFNSWETYVSLCWKNCQTQTFIMPKLLD